MAVTICNMSTDVNNRTVTSEDSLSGMDTWKGHTMRRTENPSVWRYKHDYFTCLFVQFRTVNLPYNCSKQKANFAKVFSTIWHNRKIL